MIDLPTILRDQETHTPKSYLESEAPVMKFDPTKRSLTLRSQELTLIIGDGDSEFPVAVLSTSTNQQAMRAGPVVAALVRQGTLTASNIEQTWRTPTVVDYVEIEDLENLEAMELAVYEASKKFTW